MNKLFSTAEINHIEEKAFNALNERLNGARIHRETVQALLEACLLASDEAVDELLSTDETGSEGRLALASEKLTDHYKSMGESLTANGQAETARRLYEREKKHWGKFSGSVLTVAGSGPETIYIKFGSRKSTGLFVSVTDFPQEKAKPRGAGSRAAGEPNKKRKGTGAGAKPQVPTNVAEFATLAKTTLSEDERVMLSGRIIRELAPEKRQAIIQEIVVELGFTIRKKPVRKTDKKTGTKAA